MVEVNWSDPALEQLENLTEYIAFDNASAAANLVRKVFAMVDNLKVFPEAGHEPAELPGSKYREVYVNPCRIFYRCEKGGVLIVHVMREEMRLRKYLLDFQDDETE